jgi:hypothetical protein
MVASPSASRLAGLLASGTAPPTDTPPEPIVTKADAMLPRRLS